MGDFAVIRALQYAVTVGIATAVIGCPQRALAPLGEFSPSRGIAPQRGLTPLEEFFGPRDRSPSGGNVPERTHSAPLNPASMVAKNRMNDRMNRAPTATVLVSIRWSARGLSAIPQFADRVDLEIQSDADPAIFPGGPWKATIQRPKLAGNSTARLDRIPPGTARIAATASDVQGRLLASGGVLINLRPNEIAQAKLTLEPDGDEPQIGDVIPDRGFPGQPVTLTGRGFGYVSGAPYAVRVGGIAVPTQSQSRASDHLVTFPIPLGATTSLVTIKVGSREATSTLPLATVGSVSIVPSLVILKPAATYSFSVTALDTSGELLPLPYKLWSYPLVSCTSGCLDGDVGYLDSDGVITVERDILTGILVFQLGTPLLSASSTVQVAP